MKKKISLRKLAQLAPKYLLKSNGAGFLADEQRLTGVNLTDDPKKAMHFSVGFDEQKTKTEIWTITAQRYFTNPFFKFEVEHETICTAADCNSKSKHIAETQWLEKEIIGFCEEHCPEWLKDIEIGGYSPAPKELPNLSGGHYKKIG